MLLILTWFKYINILYTEIYIIPRRPPVLGTNGGKPWEITYRQAHQATTQKNGIFAKYSHTKTHGRAALEHNLTLGAADLAGT